MTSSPRDVFTQSRWGGFSLFLYHQAGRMFTLGTNKNLTWNGPGFDEVTETDSLLFQHGCHVYLTRPLLPSPSL